MLNFIKSEWYRITHSREIYVITAIMCGLTFLFNMILAVFSAADKNFPYGTVNFSLNMVIGDTPWLFVAGGIIVWRLFAEEHEIGTLKNAVAYGISRQNIFLGKCAVCIAVSVLSLVMVFVVYAGSACLLLEGPMEGPLGELISGIGASLLCAFSAVILAIGVLQYYRKQSTAFGVWFCIIIGIPTVFAFGGMKFDILRKIAMWMPWNFLRLETVANMSGSLGMWRTQEGLIKCIAAGIAGIVIFTFAGIAVCRKQEV
ncbi:MAG: ABC transporter permease [Eubacteriales bacterium]|nr:ABC transporter permease [Eubacteriales bacterium]